MMIGLSRPELFSYMGAIAPALGLTPSKDLTIFKFSQSYHNIFLKMKFTLSSTRFPVRIMMHRPSGADCTTLSEQ